MVFFFYRVVKMNFEFFYRQFALTACVEMAKKLGDDFMPLLPETVPFLSELMEDENPDVERHCRTSIRELERTLGESIQKYL